MWSYIYSFIYKLIPFEHIHPYKLAKAVNTGDVRQIKECLKQNYDVNKRFNPPLDWSYMHEATYSITNSITILRLLLDSGADMEVKDSQGRTPLFYAVIRGNIQTIEFLTNKGGNIHSKDNDGRTMLFYAIANREYKTAKYLLKLGALEANDSSLQVLTAEAQRYLSLLKNQHPDHPKIVQRLINLDDISNWLIAYGAGVMLEPSIARFISTHQLKMTLADCTDNQIIKFTSLANIIFESWKALEDHSMSFNPNFTESIADIICTVDLICDPSDYLNSSNEISCNNEFATQPVENSLEKFIENRLTNTRPILNIKQLFTFIDKQLQEAKSPKQVQHILNEIKQMSLSLNKLKSLDLTLQESLKRLADINTEFAIKKAQEVLGDKKAQYLTNQGKKAMSMALKYNLPDAALANVIAFSPHFFAIATASKNALPQICSKIFEDKLDEITNESYVMGEDVFTDNYDI
ncbi:hypothetical protein phytr_3190 [Candidatus Phycorickettsia trachydisci]|uniref:Uncharacterized protein n=1 Tax=Candidatus Phycorickettsia trachydisci TaxID=2115978 RepID=A0A2P1P7M9_9RICK|nr:ankyrin repeat domain-containing protein [Candidatus Phycorickettsia trachydisci]AVP87273.1 hypothetical protein phytr_3190 [Candidatus Phycorickettsia trachydisci]